MVVGQGVRKCKNFWPNFCGFFGEFENVLKIEI